MFLYHASHVTYRFGCCQSFSRRRFARQTGSSHNEEEPIFGMLPDEFDNGILIILKELAAASLGKFDQVGQQGGMSSCRIHGRGGCLVCRKYIYIYINVFEKIDAQHDRRSSQIRVKMYQMQIIYIYIYNANTRHTTPTMLLLLCRIIHDNFWTYLIQKDAHWTFFHQGIQSLNKAEQQPFWVIFFGRRIAEQANNVGCVLQKLAQDGFGNAVQIPLDDCQTLMFHHKIIISIRWWRWWRWRRECLNVVSSRKSKLDKVPPNGSINSKECNDFATIFDLSLEFFFMFRHFCRLVQ